jgi:hypothetical protein
LVIRPVFSFASRGVIALVDPWGGISRLVWDYEVPAAWFDRRAPVLDKELLTGANFAFRSLVLAH